MGKLYNLARMTTATTGTGTITLGSAVSGFRTFAEAGATNGQTVSYAIRDGANSEVGRGVYTSSGTTLTRSVLISTNANSAINLSGTAEVFISALAEDFIWDDDVQGTGRTGVDDSGGVYVYEAVGAADSGQGAAGRFDGAYSYTGGTPGDTNSVVRVNGTVSAGVADYIWPLTSVLENNATAGENVAGYFQGNKNSTGATWAGVCEAEDTTETANPANGLYALELDVVANGTDSSNTRFGTQIVGWRHNAAGADVEIGYGIHIAPSAADAGHVRFKKGFAIDGLANTGLDLSGCTFATEAIRLGASDKIRWGTTSGAPMLVAVGATLRSKLADDSGFAEVLGASPTSDDSLTTRLFVRNQIRERLTAARTYYVRTDGSDSNTGLSNTSGGAFLTIQKAIDVILGTLDRGNHDVTIQCASGTYTNAVSVLSGGVGKGAIILAGDTTTPSNVTISTSGVTAITVDGSGSKLHMQGVKVTASSTLAGVYCKNGGFVRFTGKNEFGSCASGHRILVEGAAVVESTSEEVISGTAAGAHYQVAFGYLYCQGATWTASGTADQSAFAQASVNGVVYAFANTSSGTFTGVRYTATLNGVVQSNGGGANYFPGNSAGTTSTGGQYS